MQRMSEEGLKKLHEFIIAVNVSFIAHQATWEIQKSPP